MKRLGKRMALFSGVLIMALLLGEAVLRLLPPGDSYQRLEFRRQFLSITRTDPRFGMAFAPHADGLWSFSENEAEKVSIHFHTSPIPGLPGLGMRDDPVRPDAKQVILALGDSFTFGAAVEKKDIWCDRIEQQHPGLDIVNLAIPGGISKAMMIYEAAGPAIPHYGVVYQMWLGNEFWDNWVAWQIRSGLAPAPEATKNNLGELSLSERLKLTSRFFYLVYGLCGRVLELFGKAPAENKKDIRQYELEGVGFRDPLYGYFMTVPHNKLGLAYCLEGDEQGVRVGMEETRRGMAELKKLVEEQASGRLVIFLFPFKEQVYFDRIRSRVPAEVEPGRPDRIVMDYCSELEINCVDLLPALMKHRDRPLYWDVDPHFRPWGQEAASREIEKALAERGWFEDMGK